MEKNGLKRGENGLEVYVMCEIPSNVILAEQFCEIFDGFSIGSNDLTQLILGVDRDSEIVAHVFDERNEAVKKMIRSVIAVRASKGPQDRNLRPGAKRLPGVRALSGGARNRQHLAQSGCGPQGDPDRHWKPSAPKVFLPCSNGAENEGRCFRYSPIRPGVSHAG